MSTPEPVRLLEETSEASSELRRLLGSAVADEPTPEQLASLAARVGPLHTPPGPDAPPPSPPPAADALGVSVSSGLKLKVLLGTAMLTGAVGSFQVGRVYERTQAQASAQRAQDGAPAPVARLQEEEPVAPAPEPRTEPIAAPAPAASPAPLVPPPGPGPKPSGAAPKRASTPAPTVASESADEELMLLDSAHQALQRGDAEGALTSAQAHASRFPAGALAQEREVIAIEALVRLGRRPEARARAEAFSERYPASSHLIRLQGLLRPETP